MIELLNVTEQDFSIKINTSNNQVKNGVVKALGHKLATETELSQFGVYSNGSFKLIIEKKTK